MKKVSAKLFFTVMWRGLCQTLGWFFGLFGYKRDGKYAKCVWGLFATSAAIVMSFIAIALIYTVGNNAYRWYYGQQHHCKGEYCWANTCISGDIYFHNHEAGKGYICNVRTGETFAKDVKWIAEPTGKDSLVCFSDGKKRGYFSKNTGKVVIEPKYDHAWIFSDGLASVDDGGLIKFIDATGKVVIDKNMRFNPNMEGYVFHSGYCVVYTDDRELCGLMDSTGKMILQLEYNSIDQANDYGMWRIQKGQEYGILDSEMKPVVPLMECSSIYISDGTIIATMFDHSIRYYDLDGTLIYDFYITSIRTLEYEKDEILYRRTVVEDVEVVDDEYVTKEVPQVESYHPQAVARLRAYVAGDGYEGLMTAGGHKVTMPLYWNIEALDHDLYLCSIRNGEKVIVNGKGDIVK